MSVSDRESDQEDALPQAPLPQAPAAEPATPPVDRARGVPAQPAFRPPGWPAKQAPVSTVLTPGQPVAPLPSTPPPSFSFGEPPVVATLIEEVPAAELLTPDPAAHPAGASAAPTAQQPAQAGVPAAGAAEPATTTAAPLAIATSAPDVQQLQIELAAARDELKALHEMLEDLPEIFERKFQQRLATVMEHQKHLIADNQSLRERLYSLSPSDRDGGPGPGQNQPLLLPTVAPKQGWGQSLKRALGLGSSGAGKPSGQNRPLAISRPDDGRPITA